MSTISIPFNMKFRQYQYNMYNCLPDGFNRGLFVWHRRAGKDKVFINITARESIKRVGTYFYILPYYTQARAILWEGMDKDGFRFIDHIPRELIVRKDNQKMTLELQNGSFIRFLGSDNIDSIVGTNPVGVLFSEFSLHKIAAWDYLRPILLENKGWALFNGTPRGKNHMYDMYKASKTERGWYSEVLTIKDTNVMTDDEVQAEIASGMPPSLAMQEFYCSWDAALVGSFYGEQMSIIEKNGQIRDLPYDPAFPVHTAWDIGIDDTMVIWMYQNVGEWVNVIDLYYNQGFGFDHYVKVLDQKPYVYGDDCLPHDGKQREPGTGVSRRQTLANMGRHRQRIAPRAPIEEGINSCRLLLHKCRFDASRCAKGIEALKGYRAAWDDRKRAYGAPIHDWTSHFADAFRTLATTRQAPSDFVKRVPVAIGTNYDPLRRSPHERAGAPRNRQLVEVIEDYNPLLYGVH